VRCSTFNLEQDMSDDSDLPEQVPVDDNGDGEASAREDVGYCKPPRSTRFKPRQSGNPRGRPPGARGLRAELQAELGERLPITRRGTCSCLGMRLGSRLSNQSCWDFRQRSMTIRSMPFRS
jgi:hypothetical protein